MSCSLVLRGVELRYPSRPLNSGSLKQALFDRVRGRRAAPRLRDVQALRGITFDVGDGERLGVIGPNGAGKTTLLKAIAGIYPLSAGSVTSRGSIHALFELSLGFEPEATGRENITYRGLLIGQRPAEIAARVDDIVAFADLGEFIDYPVKSYSAGMLVRLAFAVSTSFGGEILLMDEVINAGDAFFIAKAKARLRQLVSRSRILVLVSHDVSAIRDLCTRALHLRHGEVVDDGPPGAVVERYLAGGGGAI
jgi:lipopolysaccharide transport system ATP-binding protein